MGRCEPSWFVWSRIKWCVSLLSARSPESSEPIKTTSTIRYPHRPHSCQAQTIELSIFAIVATCRSLLQVRALWIWIKASMEIFEMSTRDTTTTTVLHTSLWNLLYVAGGRRFMGTRFASCTLSRLRFLFVCDSRCLSLLLDECSGCEHKPTDGTIKCPHVA